MRKSKLLNFCLLAVIIAGGIFFLPEKSKATEKAQAENYQVTVTASVPSPVSVKNSTVTLNAKETLAEPATHAILLTVVLLDNGDRSLANRDVVVTSNRGEVDVIEATSKLSQFRAQAAGVSDLQKAETDDNGRASFRVTSFIPGEAELTVIADNTYKLEKQKIAFAPQPFSSNLMIVIDLPFSNREISLISPSGDENLSQMQTEAKKLSSNTRKVMIPFWLFFATIFFFLLLFLLAFSNYLNLRRLRSLQAKLDGQKKVGGTQSDKELPRFSGAPQKSLTR